MHFAKRFRSSYFFYVVTRVKLEVGGGGINKVSHVICALTVGFHSAVNAQITTITTDNQWHIGYLLLLFLNELI